MEQAQPTSWLSRLRAGLSKSATKLSDGITGIFTAARLDDDALESLEELLITSDMGLEATRQVVEGFGKRRFDKDISPEMVKEALAEEIAAILAPVAKGVDIDESRKPHVIMVVGVNGNGKTTTIGKMANRLMQGGWKIGLAAADTFRAAAVEQLQIWGQRNGCPVITGPAESDPASVAYQAYEQAKAAGLDVLIIDTAGRLQNKANLMEQLAKIVRVLKKLDADAPHSVIQILDATTGQNARNQVDVFRQIVGVTGLVVTKLDGTARGGVVVALAKAFGLPVHAVGVGEGIDDLREFDAKDYARQLLGLASAR